MMDLEILKIASDNDSNRHIQDYTHNSKLKNPLCGDEILIKLIIKKDRIVEFGSALNMNMNWDGYNLKSFLTRKIEDK